MRSLKTIIIDYDQNSLDLIKQALIAYCPYISICGEAVSMAQAKALIDSHKPELVLMDVQFAGGLGFEFLKPKIDIAYEVIFTTGLNECPDEVIKAESFNVLSKPIDIQKLISLSFRSHNTIIEKKSYAIESEATYSKKFIPIATGSSIQFLKPQEVVFIKSDGRYTTFNLTNKRKLLSTSSIGSFEKKLNPQIFFRTHNQYIANMNHIESIDTSREQHCIMTGRQLVPISKRKQTLFNTFLNVG